MNGRVRNDLMHELLALVCDELVKTGLHASDSKERKRIGELQPTVGEECIGQCQETSEPENDLKSK